MMGACMDLALWLKEAQAGQRKKKVSGVRDREKDSREEVEQDGEGETHLGAQLSNPARLHDLTIAGSFITGWVSRQEGEGGH